jgi:hypothetical protein
MSEVLLKDPSGQLVYVPQEDAQRALASKFTQPTDNESAGLKQESALQEQYGEGVGNQLKAAALGAGETASFGLLNQLLTKSGIAKPETIKQIEERNPVSHFVGEAAGAFLSPEIEALSGAKAASEAVKGMEGASALKKITTGAMAAAPREAAQGALYGAGALINENALGDKDLNAEKIMSTVGYGALFGGALGGLFGGIGGALSKEASPFVSELDQGVQRTSRENMEAALGSSLVSPEEKEAVRESFTKLKKNAKEIEQAGAELGAPVLDGQVLDSEKAQEIQSKLLNSHTSIGQAEQANLAKGLGAVSEAVENTVKVENPLTEAQMGDAIKESLTNKFEAMNKPVSEMYEKVKEKTGNMLVYQADRDLLKMSIESMEGFKFNTGLEKKLGNEVLSDLNNIKTVDDLKTVATNLFKKVNVTVPGEKYAATAIAEKLNNMYDDVILRHAEKLAKQDPELAALVEQRKVANKAYKVMRSKMEELGEVLGKKRISGAKDFINFIDDLTPEKIASKLFTKKNHEFLDFFKKEFPEEFNLVVNQQKSKLFNSAIKDGKVNAAKVIKEVDKLQPEIKEKIFSPDELKKLNAAKIWLESLPKNINPSGTAKALEMGAHYEDIFSKMQSIGAGAAAGASVAGPIGGVVGAIGGAGYAQRQVLRDYGMRAMLRGARGTADGTAENIAYKLGTIERMIHKQSEKIGTYSRRIVLGAGDVSVKGLGIMLYGSQEDKRKEYEKIKKNIDSNVSPDTYIDNSSKAIEPIHDVTPGIAVGMHASLARANEFLKSKLPQPIETPLGGKIEPSSAEISKFLRYAAAVDDPMIALKQIKESTLMPETVEAIQQVYPKLLQEMQSTIIDKITSHKKQASLLPYRTKVMLSAFTGMDLVPGISQQSIAMNQERINGPSMKQDNVEMAQQMAQKSPQSGKEKLDMSNRFKTPLQSAVDRERS